MGIWYSFSSMLIFSSASSVLENNIPSKRCSVFPSFCSDSFSDRSQHYDIRDLHLSLPDLFSHQFLMTVAMIAVKIISSNFVFGIKNPPYDNINFSDSSVVRYHPKDVRFQLLPKSNLVILAYFFKIASTFSSFSAIIKTTFFNGDTYYDFCTY